MLSTLKRLVVTANARIKASDKRQNQITPNTSHLKALDTCNTVRKRRRYQFTLEMYQCDKTSLHQGSNKARLCLGSNDKKNDDNDMTNQYGK